MQNQIYETIFLLSNNNGVNFWIRRFPQFLEIVKFYVQKFSKGVGPLW